MTLKFIRLEPVTFIIISQKKAPIQFTGLEPVKFLGKRKHSSNFWNGRGDTINCLEVPITAKNDLSSNFKFHFYLFQWETSNNESKND
jgi:hypothetical protein